MKYTVALYKISRAVLVREDRRYGCSTAFVGVFLVQVTGPICVLSDHRLLVAPGLVFPCCTLSKNRYTGCPLLLQ